MKTFTEMVVAKLQDFQKHSPWTDAHKCEQVIGAFVTDACTARVPEKEWFWWVKWMHWQVIDKNGHVVYARISLLGRPGLHRDCECHTKPTLMCWALQYDGLIPIDMEEHLVIPVTEFGPTIPVGWQVVE